MLRHTFRYEFEKLHKNLRSSDSGLFLDTEVPFIGISPKKILSSDGPYEAGF